MAFRKANFDVKWEGKNNLERLVDIQTNRVLLKINPKFFRPGEVPFLKGTY